MKYRILRMNPMGEDVVVKEMEMSLADAELSVILLNELDRDYTYGFEEVTE